jgi:hypothetical protein
MKNEIRNRLIIALIVLLAVGVIGSLVYYSARPGKLDNFAKCLGTSGAKFYGAFWCSHCQNQKELFGAAKNLLPYIECSQADGNNQTPACISANIGGYPTWVFNDQSRLSGEVDLKTLAKKTGCQLPEN